MKQHDEVRRRLVTEWLRKANEDLAAAEHLLSEAETQADVAENIPAPEHPTLGAPRYANIVAFHCQQAAEKYLKAFLTRHATEFPKTHDLEQLLDLAQTVDERLADLLRDVIVLTPYGVELRYPGDRPDVTLEQARQAVQLARKAQQAVDEAALLAD